MLENCYGQHGWKEFFTNRKNILSEYDRLLDLTVNRPIKVSHGQGVEAFLRTWLAEFLPKKYGVTSGYIIPNLYNETTLFHFDIIIYNQLEAPILWTEGNEDQSAQGKYRAIPAKNVACVIEVKSRLTKKSVKDSLAKLNQTESFKEQLSPLYTCGIIFIELKKEDENKEIILKELFKGWKTPGFFGGMVMRYEGDQSCTGLIQIFNADADKERNSEHLTPLAKPMDELKIFIKEDGNLEIGPGTAVKLTATSEGNWSVAKGYSVGFSDKEKHIDLGWSRSHFADFCIDLISRLEGIPYNDKNRPSFGQIFDQIERKKAPLQGLKPTKDQPYLTIALYEGGEHGDPFTYDDKQSVIHIIVQIENIGERTAVVSDDHFKTKGVLPPNKTAVRPLTLKVESKKKGQTINEILKKEPVEIPYRVVYYEETTNSEKPFSALEVKFKITADSASIVE